jgi:putative DNA methylase
MGFEVHAGDLNPVAVLLNKCNLELAPPWMNCSPINPEDRGRIGGAESWRGTHGLSADIRYYGRVIRERAHAKIGHLYPTAHFATEHGQSEATVIAWIWARTVASPNPAAQGRHVPLVSSFMISRKKGAEVWADPVFDELAQDGWRFLVRTGTPTGEQIEKSRLGRAQVEGATSLLTTSTKELHARCQMIPALSMRAQPFCLRLSLTAPALLAASVRHMGYEHGAACSLRVRFPRWLQ